MSSRYKTVAFEISKTLKGNVYNLSEIKINVCLQINWIYSFITFIDIYVPVTLSIYEIT